MFRLITPHLRLASVLEIDAAMLRALGVEGLLMDLDCTLKDHYATDFTPEVVAWVDRLRQAGIQLCVLTNGLARRVLPLADRLGIPCVARAIKPLPRGVHAALAQLKLDRTRVALVGDQIFADVLAGRLAGVFTILVRPTSPREPWTTRIKRPLERLVLRRLPPPLSRRTARAATRAPAPPC